MALQSLYRPQKHMWELVESPWQPEQPRIPQLSFTWWLQLWNILKRKGQMMRLFQELQKRPYLALLCSEMHLFRNKVQSCAKHRGHTMLFFWALDCVDQAGAGTVNSNGNSRGRQWGLPQTPYLTWETNRAAMVFHSNNQWRCNLSTGLRSKFVRSLKAPANLSNREYPN